MDRHGWMDHHSSWNSFHEEFERKCKFLGKRPRVNKNLKNFVLLAREMDEDSKRFFTFFWIFFGFMVFAAILCSLKKMCSSAESARQRSPVNNFRPSLIQSSVHSMPQPVHQNFHSTGPYYPTVIDVSNHSYIPERIHEVSSAPKDRGSVLIDLPPAYDDVMRTHSSDQNCEISDHGSSAVGCSDTGGTSTND